MESVGNASLSCQVYHLIEHISRPRHAETDVLCAVKHHVSSLDKVLRTFLHGNSAKECNHLFLTVMVWAGNVLQLFAQRIDGVMHREHLSRILMILIDDGVARQITHAHDAVGIVHTVFLYRIDRRVDVTTRAVEICGMNMYAQWFSTHFLGMYACREGEPVVCVDNIKV